MKSRTLYALVNAAGLLAALGTILMFGFGVFGSVVERRFRTDLFVTALTLFVAAIALRALWDIDTRLLRIEEAQHKIQRARDEHPTA